MGRPAGRRVCQGGNYTKFGGKEEKGMRLGERFASLKGKIW